MADEELNEELETDESDTQAARIKELEDKLSQKGQEFSQLNDHIQQLEGRMAERDGNAEKPKTFPAGMSEDEWEDLPESMQKAVGNLEARYAEAMETQVANLKTQDLRNTFEFKEEGPIAREMMAEWDKDKKFPYVQGEARMLMAFDMAKEQLAAKAEEEEQGETFPNQARQRGGVSPASTHKITKQTDPKLWSMAMAMKGGDEEEATKYFNDLAKIREEGRA